MNTKTFPKSRICALDIYPAFEQGLRRALKFAEDHNLSINTSDGKKVILAYCLESIESAYKNTRSQYPIVLYINSDKVPVKLKSFVDKHLENIVNKTTFPYCGKHSSNSPDLELAAENSLGQQKSKKSFFGLVKKLGIKSKQTDSAF